MRPALHLFAGRQTFFDGDGVAVQDVVCALYVYEKARKHQLGTYVAFGLAEVP
jgi:ornithine cyclodeaminase/alanine dehydrogenase-like protein (mu-crystallin family)